MHGGGVFVFHRSGSTQAGCSREGLAARPASIHVPAAYEVGAQPSDGGRARNSESSEAPVRGSRADACRRLALAGEQKCQNGDLLGGVEDLEAALKTGTHNLHLMSTVYSQLGNAYFYLNDLGKAVACHRRDLSLSNILHDSLGELKATSNLSTVFRQLGQFEDAISCARNRLELSRQLADKVSIA